MTIKEMREKLGSIAAEIRSQADASNGRAQTPEERTAWDKANADYDNLRASIDREERAAGLSIVAPPAAASVPGSQSAPGAARIVNSETRSLALAGLIFRKLGESGRITPQIQESMTACGVDADGVRFRTLRRPCEVRNMNGQVGADGGFLLPTITMTEIERAQLFYGSVRNVSAVLQTENGNTIDWPTVDDTSNEGELVSEGGTTSTGNVTVARKRWNAYTLRSKVVKLSFELVQDAPQNLEAVIMEIIGERLARGMNRYLTTGTGASQPYGVVTASTLGKTTASATAIAADEVLDLLFSVDPAYRMNASFMVNDGIALAVRKLKGSGSGDYLWQPGLQLGQPDRLLGYPISYNNHMQATVATATKTMLFGDFSKYKVREVAGVRTQVLNELYANTGEIGIQSFQRFDGNILNAGVAPIKHMLQA